MDREKVEKIANTIVGKLYASTDGGGGGLYMEVLTRNGEYLRTWRKSAVRALILRHLKEPA